AANHALNSCLRLCDEVRVARTKNLIDNQDIWLDCCRGGEHETGLHAERIGSKGLVEELIQLAELNDPFHRLGVLIFPEPTVLKRGLGVLSSGLIRVKAKTGIHQRLNFPIYFNAALRGSKISTDQFQERCLTSSISSDDTNPVAARNVQRDICQRC